MTIRFTAAASLYTLALLLACAHPSARTPAVSSADGYRLVWSDEFTGDGPLDPADWGYETGFVRNQELQWYQLENARRVNGMLVIEGRREHRPNPRYVAPSTTDAAVAPNANRRAWANREFIDYTSASVNTRGKHVWRYGRFEMRARIDVRTGAWPAFWALGTRGAWPANGEIDIMEFYDDTLLFNVAWGGANGPVWNSRKVRLDRFPPNWANAFHVWRMDWDDTKIDLYLDDVLMNTTNLADMLNPNGMSPFRQAEYMILNLAIGGQNGGDPANTTFPARFEVDYVRVFQKM